MIVNLLALLGAILYIVLQIGGPFLHITPVDLTLKNLSFSLTVLIQIIRGLAWHLGAPLPRWLMLAKMDRRFGADTTVVFLLLMAITETTLRSHLDPQIRVLDPRLTWPLMALSGGLGLWLLVLSMKKTTPVKGVGGGLVLTFSLIFFLPIILAAGLVYGLAKYFDLQGEKEIELLAVSGMTPILIAATLLALKDTHSRIKNTAGVVVVQLMALPTIPIVYMILQKFWPKNISYMFFPIILLVALAVPRLLSRHNKPWLVKERAGALLWRVSQDPALIAAPGADIEEELLGLGADLKVERMSLKCAEDHFERADALNFVGELYLLLSRYDLAEQNFNEAVSAYNTVLVMEPEHRAAQSKKFKAVEGLSQAQRLKLGPGL